MSTLEYRQQYYINNKKKISVDHKHQYWNTVKQQNWSVYTIVDKNNGTIVYVGSTSLDPRQRCIRHVAKANKDSRRKFYAFLQERGCDTIEKFEEQFHINTVISVDNKQDAAAIEKWYIQQFSNTLKNTYNVHIITVEILEKQLDDLWNQFRKTGSIHTYLEICDVKTQLENIRG